MADGHEFAEQALATGCGIDNTKAAEFEADVPVIMVKTPVLPLHMCRTDSSGICRQVQLIGITRHQGKTTTCFMIKSILEAGRDAGQV
jgi:UDP-N-acetylmuramyl pentapeptide synthase